MAIGLDSLNVLIPSVFQVSSSMRFSLAPLSRSACSSAACHTVESSKCVYIALVLLSCEVSIFNLHVVDVSYERIWIVSKWDFFLLFGFFDCGRLGSSFLLERTFSLPSCLELWEWTSSSPLAFFEFVAVFLDVSFDVAEKAL